MKPILSSKQEEVIEQLMHDSFGAQNLYVPIKYKKLGSGMQKEQCDLLWYGDNTVVLLYLKSGKKSLTLQDKSNLQQANKWLSLWKRSLYPLHCRNRFGEEIEINYKTVTHLVILSVVSSQTGIRLHKTKNEIPGFVCTVPETLIHEVAKLRGTVVDLLKLIEITSKRRKRFVIEQDAHSHIRLTHLIRDYFKPNYLFLDQLGSDDFSFVLKILDLHRLVVNENAKPKEVDLTIDRRRNYFSDMSAKEYIILANQVVQALNATKSGTLTITAVTQGLFQNWVITCTALGASNSIKLMQDGKNELKKKGFENLPEIVYGNSMEWADYRSPTLFALPERTGLTQSKTLINSICNNINTLLKI
ncbi:MAG: hypothetical protein ACXW1P_00975 [Methylophilaceae bacterium]